MSIRMRASILLMLLAAVFGLGQSQNCIPLNECPSLASLYENLGNLSSSRKTSALQYLNEIRCGFVGTTDLAKVDCPPIEEDSENNIVEYEDYPEYSEDPEPKIVEYEDWTKFLEGSGDFALEDFVGPRMGFEVITEEEECKGHMKMMHVTAELSRSLDPELEEMRSMKTTRLERKRYFNLSRKVLRNDRKLLHLEVNGNCCWQLYSEANFKGDTFGAYLGFHGLPEFNPKSMKKVSCELM